MMGKWAGYRNVFVFIPLYAETYAADALVYWVATAPAAVVLAM